MQPVYSLDTIALSALGPKPARLAVLGYPVAHSASPQMHQPALDAFGTGASYVRLEVEPGRLAEAFAAMRELNFIGCNVTVPHKFEAMATCTDISEEALILGAVNTVVFAEHKTMGHNTDGPGFKRAVADAFGISLGATHSIILGAGGGAGQAIATQCALLKPARLTLVNRSLEKIHALARRLASLSPETEIHCLGFDDPDLVSHCHAAELLIQTTSVGLKPEDPVIIPDECLLPTHCVYDTIYQPPLTPLLAAARATGCRTENGLSLLIHQGAIAFQHWFPGTEPLPYMRAAMTNR